jgi:glycosyltransferase involved in cell wall biosynthesis
MTRLVVAIVANVKRFRIPFYEQLAEALAGQDVTLKVVYSNPDIVEKMKGDSVDLSEPLGVKVWGLHCFGNRALLQLPSPALLAKTDLIITVQANGYVLNYLLLLLNMLRVKRVAFWGHAFNHQGNPDSVNERFKRWLATKVFWWFTYTPATGDYLKLLGFPPERMTVIENAVDTTAFSLEVATIRRNDTVEFRRTLGIPADAQVGIYCGSLYADKQIDFLIAVGEGVFAANHNFRLIVIGDGPDRDRIREAALSKSWLSYCGPKYGSEKAKFFAAADFFMHPGAVGLAILDSFAAGLPFVTSDYAGHGPEIGYLENGSNGLMLPFELDAFISETNRILVTPELLVSLREGASAAGRRYTVENMVSNVANGVLKCLSAN